MPINQTDPKPFYKQVMDEIVHRIDAGELKAGDKIETQYELAKRYDVSLITIKRALSELISAGLLYARVGKGTFVAIRKPSIDFSKHKTIAYVLKDLDNPFYASIVSSVERHLSKNDYNFLLYSSDNRKEKEDRKIKDFISMGVSGLIIGSMSHIHYTTSLLKQLHNKHFPFVMVSYTEDPEISFIGTDQEEGGYLATKHLINLGYKKIGYINGEEGNLVGECRKRGFIRAMEESNVSLNENYLYRLKVTGKRNDYKSGYNLGQQFFTIKDWPDSLFIYNDLSALGFIKALSEQGVKVPQDVAIVGFDDINMGETAAVPLTTVHQPTAKIGEYVVKCLLSKIEGEKSVARKVMKPKLIIRESCGEKLYS